MSWQGKSRLDQKLRLNHFSRMDIYGYSVKRIHSTMTNGNSRSMLGYRVQLGETTIKYHYSRTNHRSVMSLAFSVCPLRA